MLKRILAFSGIPVFTGFLLFPFFYFLKVGCSLKNPLRAAGLEILIYCASPIRISQHAVCAGDTAC